MPGSFGLDNDSVRVRRQIYDAWQRGDLDAAAARYGEEPSTRRRLGLSTILVGRDAQIEQLKVTASLVDAFRVEHRPIGVRGDRTSLTHATLTAGTDEAPDVLVEMLVVGSVDDQSRIARTVVFDAQEFQSAYEELDRLFVDGEGAPYADNVRCTPPSCERSIRSIPRICVSSWRTTSSSSITDRRASPSSTRKDGSRSRASSSRSWTSSGRTPPRSTS